MNKSLIKTIKDSYIAIFDTEPLMIFSPGRINILGKHNDYNDGFVFPAAVDKAEVEFYFLNKYGLVTKIFQLNGF